MRLPRWIHALYAAAAGYFWLPCPRCGRMFGGHETRSDPGFEVIILGASYSMTCGDCQREGVYSVPTSLPAPPVSFAVVVPA